MIYHEGVKFIGLADCQWAPEVKISDLTTLLESIRKLGQVFPITVIEQQTYFEVIDGVQRVKAMRELGWKMVVARPMQRTNPCREVNLEDLPEGGYKNWLKGKSLPFEPWKYPNLAKFVGQATSGYINDYGCRVPNKCNEIGLDGHDYDKIGMLLHPNWLHTFDLLQKLNAFKIPNCSCTQIVLPLTEEILRTFVRIHFDHPFTLGEKVPTRWVCYLDCRGCKGTGQSRFSVTDASVK